MYSFPIGDIMASEAVQQRGIDIAPYIERHRQGDWSADDQLDNAWALRHGRTITSTFLLADGDTLWVDTLPERTITEVYLHSERPLSEVDLRDGYAMWATSYDDEKNPLIAIEEAYTERLLRPMAFRRALDVGTGTGRHALRLAQRGAMVTGIDQSPDMLAVAQRSAEHEGVTLDLRQGTVEDGLTFEDKQFDLVVSALMLSHVADLDHACAEFFRVLQPGGWLLISDFHPDIVAEGWRAEMRHAGTTYHLPNPGGTRTDYLDAVCEAGFEIVETHDALLSESPDDYIPATLRRDYGEKPFCFIIWARRPEG